MMQRRRPWPAVALAVVSLAAAARGRLADIAATASEGLMLPEQVWDDQAPPGRTPGTGGLSATPLVWTHAQFVGSPGRSTPGAPSSARTSWPAATRCAAASRRRSP